MLRKSLHPLVIAAALAAASSLPGQSVHWDPPGGTLPVGEVSQLQLTFDDCSPDTTPSPPKVDGLTLVYQGQSSSMSLINGTFSRSVSLTYSALLQRQQEAVIPSFSVATNKGKLDVPAAHFAPAGATVGTSGVSLGDAASAALEPSSESVWAGEVFDLKYTVQVGEGYNPSWGRGVFEWDPAPLVTEDWSQPEPFRSTVNGPKTGLSYRTRAIAPAAGHLRLNPTSQLVNLSVGVTGFGFFQQRQYQQFAIPDGPVSIDVRPLPPAPQGFTGAVGDFKIASKVVPSHVRTGDPVTWTLELSGSGNWPEIRGLPAREVSKDFQVIQPKPKMTQPQGKLFDGSLSEDVVLIPTSAGTYELAPTVFTYFDPKSSSYVTVSAPGATVIVDPAAPPGAGAAPGQLGAAPGVPAISLETPAVQAKAPEAPAPGLGDPLAPAARAFEPLGGWELSLACAAPFVLVGLYWMVLAQRRARATDPLKGRRDARLRIADTLETLRGAPSVDRPPLLLAWQRDTAILWDVAHAAPPASSLGDPQWAALWGEADRCLYGPQAPLATDWVVRAQAALGGKALNPFRSASLLLPRNLFPFLALAACVAAGARAAAADPAADYRAGNFQAAGAAWEARTASDPLDWSSRHNLSLALSQQDRWGEAAAEAAGAFVQNPSDAALRRQLAISCDKAGFVPEPLDLLVQSGPLAALARLGSPGAWQRVGVGAAATAAAGLALLLALAYMGFGRRWALPTALGLLGAALLAAAASVAAYRAYGIAADTRAVVVWRAGTLRSIPTEADVSQKTTPLPAGSTALADKTFIGWTRLSFPNGETGWIPSGEAIPLWRSQPK